MPNVILIGAPIDDGQRRAGCVMGPAAYRVAGLAGAVRELGHAVQDWGDVAPPEPTAARSAGLDAGSVRQG
jgi:arginase